MLYLDFFLRNSLFFYAAVGNEVRPCFHSESLAGMSLFSYFHLPYLYLLLLKIVLVYMRL